MSSSCRTAWERVARSGRADVPGGGGLVCRCWPHATNRTRTAATYAAVHVPQLPGRRGESDAAGDGAADGRVRASVPGGASWALTAGVTLSARSAASDGGGCLASVCDG